MGNPDRCYGYAARSFKYSDLKPDGAGYPHGRMSEDAPIGIGAQFACVGIPLYFFSVLAKFSDPSELLRYLRTESILHNSLLARSSNHSINIYQLHQMHALHRSTLNILLYYHTPLQNADV